MRRIANPTRTPVVLPILLALLIPSAAWAVDADGDGFDEVWDCDDTDPTINFLAQDAPGDGIDSDCNTLDGPMQDSDGDNLPDGFENQYGPSANTADTDGDGVDDLEECQLDLPGGCQTIDEDGDGVPAYADPDEPFAAGDADGDGFPASQDCDDTDASVFPGAPEVCDGVDNDCNGIVDDAPQALAWYADADMDGYGSGSALLSCVPPPGHASIDGDCDDQDASVNPSADEMCDGLDNDCDGLVDEDAVDSEPQWQDADADGFGNPAVSMFVCAWTPGWADNPTDCDDADASINPDAQDLPNDGIDQDCDGADAGGSFDADGDGFAAPDDCNDSDPSVYPGAQEVCDGIDNDCNGTVDDVGGGGFLPAPLWYDDQDGDGYGAGSGFESCVDPGPGYSNVAGDCDDQEPTVYPGAPEFCDGFDNDCDGLYDEGLGTVLYIDNDGDGYGDEELLDCSPPGPDVSTVGGDCDDFDPTVNPGAIEIPGDGIDQDCDGFDEDTDPAEDADGDGFTFFEDCDDTDASIFPGAPELCDGIDSNCDGIAEEDSDLDGLPDACDDCPNQVGPEDNGGCPDDTPGDDLDGDGYAAPDDCDDSDPIIFPGAIEICEDGIDQSCDGQDASCNPVDDEEDDKPSGCVSSGTGASFTAMFLPLPLFFGLARRRTSMR